MTMEERLNKQGIVVSKSFKPNKEEEGILLSLLDKVESNQKPSVLKYPDGVPLKKWKD